MTTEEFVEPCPLLLSSETHNRADRLLDTKRLEGPIKGVDVESPRLSGEPKDEEEEECQSTGGAHKDDKVAPKQGNSVDQETTIKVDSEPVKLGHFPRYPRVHGRSGGVFDEGIDKVGNADDQVDAAEPHETEVSVLLHSAAVGREEHFKRLAAFEELMEGEQAISGGYHCEHEWPHEVEGIGQGDIICRHPASNIFIDVVAVSLNETVSEHNEEGNPQTNKQVDDQISPLLRFGDDDSFGLGQFIKLPRNA